PSCSLYILFDYQALDFTNFATLYLQMRTLPYDFFYIGIIGLILAVLSVSILLGVVDRHMRVGEFSISFNRAKTRMDYNIVTAFKFVVLAGVMFELFNLLLAVFYYLWAIAFGSGVAWLVLSIISFLLVSFLILMFFSLIILWPAFMLHTGMRGIDAFKTGMRHISKHLSKVSICIVAVVLPIQLIMIITGALDCGIVVKTVLDGICYAIAVPYYIVLMYTVFYDVTGTERVDLEKVDIWAKKRKLKTRKIEKNQEIDKYIDNDTVENRNYDNSATSIDNKEKDITVNKNNNADKD
ncbi:MAG: hypothetical protein RSC44_05020, partial [Clostridia bacterium]